MTLDEIRTAFETADGLPAQALTSAVDQASALAPEVIALIDKAVAGAFLMPKQEGLLFFGLHALAAAGETGVYRPLMALLRLPEWQLDRLLGDASTATAAGMLLALYDGDADPLFAAIEDPKTDGGIRWGLFQVIARLTWEGRIPRTRTIELLDRFDREELADPDDVVWIGWQDAIMYLGIEEMEPRVRRAWKSGRACLHREVDQREWQQLFRKALASPEDPQRFIDDHIVPMTDPVASLAWLDRPAPKVRRAYGTPADPADDLKLTPGEIDWLGDFLVSDQASATGMTFEMVDGYFTATISQSESAQLSAHLPTIWGDGEEAFEFDSPEQADFVLDLLTRHWNTIALRLRAGVPHEPALSWSDREDKGRPWATGFTVALSHESDVWTAALEDESAGPFLAPILSLIADEYDNEAEPISSEYRAAIVEALPDTVMALRHYFRHGVVPPRARPVRVPQPRSNEPVRVTKIGRNEPCPCGSGRKYKKCCGAAA